MGGQNGGAGAGAGGACTAWACPEPVEWASWRPGRDRVRDASPVRDPLPAVPGPSPSTGLRTSAVGAVAGPHPGEPAGPAGVAADRGLYPEHAALRLPPHQFLGLVPSPARHLQPPVVRGDLLLHPAWPAHPGATGPPDLDYAAGERARPVVQPRPAPGARPPALERRGNRGTQGQHGQLDFPGGLSDPGLTSGARPAVGDLDRLASAGRITDVRFAAACGLQSATPGANGHDSFHRQPGSVDGVNGRRCAVRGVGHPGTRQSPADVRCPGRRGHPVRFRGGLKPARQPPGIPAGAALRRHAGTPGRGRARLHHPGAPLDLGGSGPVGPGRSQACSHRLRTREPHWRWHALLSA